jgi:nucleoside-diphosphate-sugar epimerase
MSENRIYVVGGSGYIGSHLMPALISDGWDPVNIDAGIYGHMPAMDKTDILDDDFQIPQGQAPVIWLATLHREPPGFETLGEKARDKWINLAHTLMIKKPHEWLAAGHPMIYASSQMSFTSPDTLYGQTKRMFESLAVGNFVQVFRFGTVWGGLQRDPSRPQTALNAALLGKFPSPNYMSYTTSIHRAVTALALALYRPFNGTVENVFDSDEPITGEIIRNAFDVPPKARTAWQIEFVRSADLSNGRKRSLRRRKHPTELLAAYYNLPWPEEIKPDVRKEETAAVVEPTQPATDVRPAGHGLENDGRPELVPEPDVGDPGAGGGEAPDPSYHPKFAVVERESADLGGGAPEDAEE